MSTDTKTNGRQSQKLEEVSQPESQYSLAEKAEVALNNLAAVSPFLYSTLIINRYGALTGKHVNWDHQLKDPQSV